MTTTSSEGADEHAQQKSATLAELCLGFATIGILGFGGVIPWVRWLLVERKAWYTEEEFVNTFALANFIPGGNVVSLAVITGAKLNGWMGSAAALLGLIVPSAAVVCLVGSIYLEYRDTALARNILGAMAAAGAGLILGMAIKLLRPMRQSVRAMAMVAAVFVAASVFHTPLAYILLTLGPVSLALAVLMRN